VGSYFRAGSRERKSLCRETKLAKKITGKGKVRCNGRIQKTVRRRESTPTSMSSTPQRGNQNERGEKLLRRKLTGEKSLMRGRFGSIKARYWTYLQLMNMMGGGGGKTFWGQRKEERNVTRKNLKEGNDSTRKKNSVRWISRGRHLERRRRPSEGKKGDLERRIRKKKRKRKIYNYLEKRSLRLSLTRERKEVKSPHLKERSVSAVDIRKKKKGEKPLPWEDH